MFSLLLWQEDQTNMEGGDGGSLTKMNRIGD